MAIVPGTATFDSNTNPNLNTQRASGMPDILDNGGKLAITTTNITVEANGSKVGFIQSFNPSESRNIIKVQELGTEGVVQSVPSNTNGGQLSITRFAVYNSNLFNALGATRNGKFSSVDNQSSGTTLGDNNELLTYSNPFKTLKDQRVPLEIVARTTTPNGTVYIERYIDCWLASYSKTVAATTITVTETATVQYSDVLVI